MSDYNKEQAELDFISRTLEIVRFYSKHCPYEVTLQINCLLGLVVLPKEKTNCWDELLDTPHGGEEEGIKVTPEYKLCGNAEGYNPETLRGLVFHLRHAVAHFKVTTKPDEKGEIAEVVFCNDHNDTYVEISIEAKFIPDLMRTIAGHLIETKWKET